MKRLARDTDTFDPLELFSKVSRQQGYRIGLPADIDEFQKHVGNSLRASLDRPSILHGKRTEAMFVHVLGALSGCSFVKQEDTGAVFSTSNEFCIPDYRVITTTGDLLLIEVKNFHMKGLLSKFYLQKKYIGKLVAYANANKAKLKIAVYFSRINEWVLLSPNSFLESGSKLYVDLPHAMARNEMADVGDRRIATLPPLSIEFIGEISDESAIINDEGTAQFTIREVNMRCGGKLITNDKEKSIASYLIRYGSWVESVVPAEVVNGKIASFQFTFAPRETEDHGQPFDFVGSLSSMVSTAFSELTTDQDSKIIAIDVKQDPDAFQVKIPIDYKGDALPLWQIVLQPNYNPMN